MVTVTRTVGATPSPEVPDFATLQEFCDALPPSLVSADESWVAEVYDQGVVDEFLLPAVETDDTHTITIRCAAGAGFADKAGARNRALAYDESNGVAVRGDTAVAIEVKSSNVLIQGLQISVTVDGVACVKVQGPDQFPVSNVVFDRCILYAPSSTGCVVEEPDGSTATFRSCLLLTGGDYASGGGSDGTFSCLFGSTLVHLGTTGGVGVNNQFGLAQVENTAIFNFTTPWNSFASHGHNATDGAVLDGLGTSLVGLSKSAQFALYGSDWRTVSTGSLDGAGGTSLTRLVTDILGRERPRPPAIGCWDFIDGPTNDARVVIQKA